MAINVWFVIWPNQKIVIASAQQVAAGGEALAEAAAAAPKAAGFPNEYAFSIPMLFFMGSSAHARTVPLLDGATTASLVAVFAIILVTRD